MQHREQETRDEPAPAAATSAAAAGLGQEEAGGDTQTATGATAVGPSIGEPVAELDSPRGEEDSEALGVVVMLTDPQQMANAVFLKSEKIVYCPIQKVTSPLSFLHLFFCSNSLNGRVKTKLIPL